LRENGSIILTTDSKQDAEFRNYVANKEQRGVSDAVYVHAEIEYFTNTTHFIGGIYQKQGAQFSAAKFVFGLTKLILENGVNVQTGTHVTQVSKCRDYFTLKTNNNLSINAISVVYATNGYTAGLLPQLKDIIVPTRGQVIVTSPVKLRFPVNMEMNYGYEYMIQREDCRIVLGGMRWKSPQQKKKEKYICDDSIIVPEISKGLCNFLPEAFPSLAKEQYVIEKEWTGIMGFTPDEYPLVGCLSSTSQIGRIVGGEYILAGYTGNGMPNCFGAGKVIAEMICGKLKPDQFLKSYSPLRFIKNREY